MDNNLDEIARISDNFVTFKYTGYGGDIVCDPDKTTTVIGKFTDNYDGGGIELIKNSGVYKYGENPGGINILNEPSWNGLSQEARDILNQEWLESAFHRGDNIKLISNPNADMNVFIGGDSINGLSQYGKEVNLWLNDLVINYGYVFDSNTKTYYLP